MIHKFLKSGAFSFLLVAGAFAFGALPAQAWHDKSPLMVHEQCRDRSFQSALECENFMHKRKLDLEALALEQERVRILEAQLQSLIAQCNTNPNACTAVVQILTNLGQKR